MSQQQSCQKLANAFKERAQIYLSVFRELSARYGQAEAVSVMRSASRRCGEAVGAKLTQHSPRDFQGMLEAFFKAPDDGATFSPEVKQLDDTCLEVKMMCCPLKDAWIEAGCSDEEVCTLLYCASGYDEAVYEAAGFAYELELWTPGKTGCCRTKITEKSAPSDQA